MAGSKKIAKFLKWVAASFVALVILIFCLLYFGAQPWLNKNLSEYVSKKTSGLYRFGFDKIELQFAEKGFLITGINLTHDLAIAKKLQAEMPEKVFYSFTSPEIRVDNLSLLKFLLSGEIRISLMTIENPRLQLTGPELFSNDSTRMFEYALDEIRPFFKRYIRLLEIAEIEFVDANYQFFNLVGDTARISKADKVSVGITRFRTGPELLANHANPYSTDDIFVRIKGFRNEMSDSLHFLEIDSMEYSLKNAELKAFNSSLSPSAKTGGKSLYEVKVPKFLMRSQNLKGFRFADSLDISYLEFEDPEIIFTQKNNPKKLRIEDINNFDLFELVRNDLSIIRIDSFLLKNAKLTIFKKSTDAAYQQKLEDIDINLLGFELDSTSGNNKAKLLYADEIEMKIRGYELILEDNFHRFTADSVYVSTISDSLSVSHIKINPLKNVGMWAPVIVRIDCKNVSLDEVDLKEVYHRRIVPGSVVEISQPVVSIENYPEFKKRKGEPGLLFSLVSAYLKGVYSRLIQIDDGSLSYKNFSQNLVADEFESKFSFTLTDFSLDSASQKRTDKFFYATSFDLNFSDYKMQVADNLHKLAVKKVHISNSDSRIQIDSLRLSPVSPDISEELMKQYGKSELYDISVPEISLQNANLHKAFFDNDLEIDSFKIRNPRIWFEDFGSLKTKNKRFDFEELYDLIFKYVNDISINNLALPSGKIRWISHSKKGKTISLDNQFSAELINFRLNKTELDKHKLLFSEQIRLSLKDQNFSLSDSVHFLKAGQIDFSTIDRRIEISDALLYPDVKAPGYHEKPATIKVAIPKLTLDGVDIAEAWSSKKINVGGISFSKPKLEVFSHAKKIKTLDLKKFNVPLPRWVESLNVAKLDLSGGQVITYTAGAAAPIQNSSFNLDLESENLALSHSTGAEPNSVKSGNISAKISDFQLEFNDKSHVAKVDELKYQKLSQAIRLRNFRLITLEGNQAENRFDISVPEANLTGFDIEAAYENNRYIFDKIVFESPSVKINLADSIKNGGLRKFSNLNLYDYLEPYFTSLEIGGFTLANAGIDLNTAKTDIRQENIHIAIRNISIGSQFNKHGLLNSDGFEFLAFNYSKLFDDNQYRFKIDTIKYSSFTNQAELRSASIHPEVPGTEIIKAKGFQTDIVDAEFNSVVLQGFDYDEWINERIIRGGKLYIGPARLDIFRDNRYPFNKNQRPAWPQQLLEKIKQLFEVDSVIILPSEVQYSEMYKTSNSPMSIHFGGVVARAGKLSNLKKPGETPDKLTVTASGKIAEEGLVNIAVDFYLDSREFRHHVKGNLEPVEMTAFNSILEKSANLKVEQGLISRFDFDFTADNNSANGDLYFGYDFFKIGVFNIRHGDTVKSAISTFMANSFMIDSKNPRGKTFEPEKIIYRRDPSRSILNYWWKAIFNSSKTAIGIKEQKADKIQSLEGGH